MGGDHVYMSSRGREPTGGLVTLEVEDATAPEEALGARRWGGGGGKPGSGSLPGAETEGTLSLDILPPEVGRWENGRSAVKSRLCILSQWPKQAETRRRRHRVHRTGVGADGSTRGVSAKVPPDP